MIVDFYFTVSSRYSYLASTQLDGIAERTGCSFAWKPLNNHAILARSGADPFRSEHPTSGQYDWAYREKDAKDWANFYGVPFVEPVNFRKDPPWLVRSCYAAEACGRLIPFCQQLFQTIFVDSRAISESDLPDFAISAGIDETAFGAALESKGTEEREKAVLEEAATKGVFGVPTFTAEDAFFWGNDRLILLEHLLSSQS